MGSTEGAIFLETNLRCTDSIILRPSSTLEKLCTSAKIRAVQTKFRQNVANEVYENWKV